MVKAGWSWTGQEGMLIPILSLCTFGGRTRTHCILAASTMLNTSAICSHGEVQTSLTKASAIKECVGRGVRGTFAGNHWKQCSHTSGPIKFRTVSRHFSRLYTCRNFETKIIDRSCYVHQNMWFTGIKMLLRKCVYQDFSGLEYRIQDLLGSWQPSQFQDFYRLAGPCGSPVCMQTSIWGTFSRLFHPVQCCLCSHLVARPGALSLSHYHVTQGI